MVLSLAADLSIRPVLIKNKWHGSICTEQAINSGLQAAAWIV